MVLDAPSERSADACEARFISAFQQFFKEYERLSDQIWPQQVNLPIEAIDESRDKDDENGDVFDTLEKKYEVRDAGCSVSEEVGDGVDEKKDESEEKEDQVWQLTH